MILLKVQSHFDAAHKLDCYNGPCANMHGHRWEVVCTFRVDGKDKSGISADFKEVKGLIKSALPDHVCLNDVFPFSPSAENLAPALADAIQIAIAGSHREFPHLIPFLNELVRLELFESPDCSVVWEAGK